jgi:hypothetical protein
MRAREFVMERSQKSLVKTNVRLHPEHEKTMKSAHRVAGTADRLYDLSNIMRYVAVADGLSMPFLPGKESWAGRNNTAHPYSKIEAEMLKHAYKMAGIEWDNVLDEKDSNHSKEPETTNKASPVKPFRGYKR